MRFSFLFNEVLTGLRRNITMTVAMILTTAISIGLFGGGLLVVRLADHSRSIYLDRVETQVFLDQRHFRQRRDVREPTRARRCARRSRGATTSSRCGSSIAKTPTTTRSARSRSSRTWQARTRSRRHSSSSWRTPSSTRTLTPRCRASPGLTIVLNQKDLIDRLFAVLDGFSDAAFAVALVQAVGAILLIANMVQVAAYTRREPRLASCGWSAPPAGIPSCRSWSRRCVAATLGVVIAIVGLIVVRALFLDNALSQFYQAQSDRPGRLRRHPLHRPVAAIGGRRDGRGHVVRNVAPVRAAVAGGQKAAGQVVSQGKADPGNQPQGPTQLFDPGRVRGRSGFARH